MSDLVERLREGYERAQRELECIRDEIHHAGPRHVADGLNEMWRNINQAAARITELEAALAEAEGRVKEARRQALEEAAKACDAERLCEPQDDSDAAYDNAIDHCVQSIRALASDPLLDRQGKEGV